MVIRNTDGTPFQLTGSLQRFDPLSPAHDLFNVYDSEVIMLYGSPLFYYEVMIQIENIDRLYIEDRTKLWNPNYQMFYGFYEPIEQQNPSTQFGIDGIGEVVFECNTRAVVNAIGHMPKRGSRIHTPHLGENWVVVDTRLTQFQLWGAIHLQIICERFRESLTDSSSTVPQPQRQYPIY